VSRESENPENKCMFCPIMDIAPCPILEIAYDKGLDGMETCEMWHIVKKLVAQIRFNAKLGPKSNAGE